MAYDEELADRVRAEIGRLEGLTERRLPGGLAFLINGNMALCVSDKGGILVQVDPRETQRLIRTSTASEWEVDGRVVEGWVRVGTNDVRTASQVRPWVRRAVGYVSDLPRQVPAIGAAEAAEAPPSPGDAVRAATPEQWADLIAARAELTPMPLTRPQRERAVAHTVRALYDMGAVSGQVDWPEWAPEHFDETLASLATADLDDVVALITTAVRQDRVVDGALDAALANGSFTRVIDRLLLLRPRG